MITLSDLVLVFGEVCHTFAASAPLVGRSLSCICIQSFQSFYCIPIFFHILISFYSYIFILITIFLHLHYLFLMQEKDKRWNFFFCKVALRFDLNLMNKMWNKLYFSSTIKPYKFYTFSYLQIKLFRCIDQNLISNIFISFFIQIKQKIRFSDICSFWFFSHKADLKLNLHY